MRTVMAVAAVLLGACAAACGERGREYELRGQILSVARDRHEITVKHEDIRGFMPAMTMPFTVQEDVTLDEWQTGDLIRATLVVRDSDAYLARIERIGHEPISEPVPTTERVEVVEPGDPAPDAAFVDQDGTPRRIADWRGQVVVVTFIYTRCPLPDFCPRMDRHFATIQREAAADPTLRGHVRLASVSFDPGFDTPSVLKAHAARAGADPAVWSYLTGDADDVHRFAEQFGVSIVRDDPSAGNILHNLRTAVIGPDGRLMTILTGNEWSPSEVLADLRAAGAGG